MEAPEELRGLTRNGLSKIAAQQLNARGPRKDGGLLSSWAMRLLCGKSLPEIREITFEIGMLGKYGLDINDPQESHVLRALPERVFSALQLICIMYARLAEDRAGDGYRGGAGRGVGDGGEADRERGLNRRSG